MPSSERLHEKCAVVGFYNTGPEAARLAAPALMTLQHRGQESSGIAVSHEDRLKVHKDMGLVASVYRPEDIDRLPGSMAIGHNRYSTDGPSSVEHAQPVMREDRLVTFAHNGNLPVTEALEKFLVEKNALRPGSNDSEMMADALEWYVRRGASLGEAMMESFPLFTGAFSVVAMTKDSIVAARDEYGIRPLSIGKINGGYVFASETCALDTVQARHMRDVRPGELIVVDSSGFHSHELARAKQKLDIFEYVYFARPDSMLLGKSVNEVRWNLGIQLAKEHPVKADIVIPIPDSAIPAAEGYAYETHIPMRQGFAKNRYIHRTFITPNQRLREAGVKLKLNPLEHVLAGKRVAVVDDSIVRATTARDLVTMLRNKGAVEVHFMVSSPPVRYPDFYGINTPEQAQLVAAHKSVDEIRQLIGADSLNYLSYPGLIAATGVSEDLLCTSCFTGEYPIEIGEENRKGIIFEQKDS
jgi:amidophosphoribosyltransferase